MKSLLPILGFLLWSAACSKTDSLLNPAEHHEVTTLPSVLTESSGLEMTSGEIFWSHNDRNGKAELYGFETTGVLKTTLKVTNATNTDWEDIACDKAGNIFIGDFGNNDNDRRNLRIYKIAPPPGEQANLEMPAEKIEFSYPEQTEYPPPDGRACFSRQLHFVFDQRSKIRPPGNAAQNQNL
ncbi:MAG: hypothetical protein ACKVT2_20365 [Saprospiraceae bacterium]